MNNIEKIIELLEKKSYKLYELGLGDFLD